MSPPVIAFDLDGTLVDTAPDLIGTLNWLLEAQGFAAMDPGAVRPLIGFGARVMIERSLQAQGAALATDEVTRLHRAFLAYYGEHIADASRPFPGLLAALDRLAGLGCRLAVCTNKGEDLSRRLLDRLGLAERFAAICGADTFAARKPDPSHLTGTIERAGGLPRAAVMVGDSVTDIETARRASVPVVAVDFGYTETPVAELGPDVVISHYDELVGALERFAPAVVSGRSAARA